MPTILVADDNSNIQKMVKLALEEHGVEVIAVGNGEAAVRKLSEVKPDLVLADIFMPVRTGYEVCEFIKHDAHFANIPVILLVGAFDPLDEREAQRVGADGILKKPFVPPDPLIAMVTSTLERFGRLRESAPGRQGDPAEDKLPGEAIPQDHGHDTVPEPVPVAAEESEAEAQPFPVFARTEFSVSDAPVAFGELLDASADLATTAPAPLRDWASDGAGFGGFSGAPADLARFTEPETKELESIPQEVITRPGESLTAKAPPELQVADAPPPELAANPTEWIEQSPSLPHYPAAEEESWVAAPPVAPAPPEANPAEPFSPAPEPAPQGESPSAPSVIAFPTPLDPWAPPRVESQDNSREPERLPAAEESMAQEIAPSAETSAPFSPPTGEPMRLDSMLVDEVVERVLEALEPEIHEILARDIIRPVAESYIRQQLEKKNE